MNANKPAYPQTHDAMFDANGLTKREYAAIAFHAALLSTRIVHLDTNDTALLAIRHVDALFAELERTK